MERYWQPLDRAPTLDPRDAGADLVGRKRLPIRATCPCCVEHAGDTRPFEACGLEFCQEAKMPRHDYVERNRFPGQSQIGCEPGEAHVKVFGIHDGQHRLPRASLPFMRSVKSEAFRSKPLGCDMLRNASKIVHTCAPVGAERRSPQRSRLNCRLYNAEPKVTARKCRTPCSIPTLRGRLER